LRTGIFSLFFYYTKFIRKNPPVYVKKAEMGEKTALSAAPAEKSRACA
jgi:hypothetical protein